MPQLNPEFFASQLFWLIISFSFLLLFLWRVSLPRISSVLEKRESKINNDIQTAKQLQAEAEKIQNKIEEQLSKAHEESVILIKKSTSDLQNKASEELLKIDNELNKKIEVSASILEKNRKESLDIVHKQICEITKLAISKLSSIPVNDTEIKEFVAKVQPKTLQ